MIGIAVGKDARVVQKVADEEADEDVASHRLAQVVFDSSVIDALGVWGGRDIRGHAARWR